MIFRTPFLPLLLLLCCSCGRRKNACVVLHTNMGDIKVRLFDSTPGHRDHFLASFTGNPADTLLFYRVERDFTIQFGPPPGKTPPGHRPNPEIEAPLSGGALVSASAGPNKLPDGTNFFIVMDHPQTDASLDAVEKKRNLHFTPEERAAYKKYGGQPLLHGQYTVFGEVTAGMEVAQKIAALPRDANARPLQRVWAVGSSSSSGN
ncbi:MAG: peptidylprolyl isomerase [Saprospiraceae bacterium]|nr:peptidylprolyl isomerase [Saprospiraceae bacterium]